MRGAPVPPTAQALIAAKVKLERDVLKLVTQCERNTGMQVSDLQLQRVEANTTSGTSTVVVGVRAELRVPDGGHLPELLSETD